MGRLLGSINQIYAIAAHVNHVYINSNNNELDVVNEAIRPMTTVAGACHPLRWWTWRGWMSLMLM